VYLGVAPGLLGREVRLDINADIIRCYGWCVTPWTTRSRCCRPRRQPSSRWAAIFTKSGTRIQPVAPGCKVVERSRRSLHAGTGGDVDYLNRTGFNGLFRLNSRGTFNVPRADIISRICDEELRRLGGARPDLSSRAVRASAAGARASDFVYLDPPYAPVSATARVYAAGFERNNRPASASGGPSRRRGAWLS
jgi:hypothetical protein